MRRVLTVHELEELVDHSFQELPVRSEKTGVLANDVHDVGGDDGLVVLSSFLLTQTEQVLEQTHNTSAPQAQHTVHTQVFYSFTDISDRFNHKGESVEMFLMLIFRDMHCKIGYISSEWLSKGHTRTQVTLWAMQANINLTTTHGQCHFLSYLDDSDQEPLLVLLVHGPADGPDGPAQRVEVLPGPLGAIHLVVQLLRHYALCVRVVQVSQVHCRTEQQHISLFYTW